MAQLNTKNAAAPEKPYLASSLGIWWGPLWDGGPLIINPMYTYIVGTNWEYFLQSKTYSQNISTQLTQEAFTSKSYCSNLRSISVYGALVANVGGMAILGIPDKGILTWG